MNLNSKQVQYLYQGGIVKMTGKKNFCINFFEQSFSEEWNGSYDMGSSNEVSSVINESVVLFFQWEMVFRISLSLLHQFVTSCWEVMITESLHFFLDFA